MNCTWAEHSDLVSGRKEARVHELSVSEAARARLLSVPGEPLFIADWNRVLMIHYEVDPVRLQTEVPFELDLSEGRAFVTLVAFTLRDLRLRFGGWLSSWLTKPIATHEFLNVRTYVRYGTETGIYFLREWLSNRLSVAFGPSLFGLPYLHGRIQYQHELGTRAMSGSVLDSTGKGAFSYRAILGSEARFSCCEAGTLTEWLMERYSAFT